MATYEQRIAAWTAALAAAEGQTATTTVTQHLIPLANAEQQELHDRIDQLEAAEHDDSAKDRTIAHLTQQLWANGITPT